jgi:hypothetical protein
MSQETKMEYAKDFDNVLNYKYDDYNNYNSWSNKQLGKVTISSIDEYNNIQTKQFDNNKLHKLNSPYQTFADTSLVWMKNKDDNEIEINNEGDIYKKFKDNNKQHNEYTNLYPYKFLEN